MQSLTYHVAISTDGFIADPQGGFDDFSTADDVVADFVAAMQHDYDTVLMGRKTYDVGLKVGKTNPYPWLESHVFSTQLKQSPDPAVQLHSGGAVELVRQLRQRDRAKGIWLCGGAELAGQLLQAGLIDRLTLKVNPFVMGTGIPLFREVTSAHHLELTEHKAYPSGVLLVSHRVTYSQSASPASQG